MANQKRKMGEGYNSFPTLQDKLNYFITNRVETKDGCWLLPKKILKPNPAHLKYDFRYKYKKQGLHRVALELLVLNRPVRQGFETCHIPECYNPACFNPKHLYEGTRTDNLIDRSKAGNSYFTKEDIQFIRYCIKNKVYTKRELACMFECSYETIRKIWRKKHYSWVEEE